MPLPNGIDPWGRIQPICLSAEYMGNRGILHGVDGVVTRQWKNTAWVTCALHYGERNRKPLMQPNRYSELFFLDEATSFAAGHRPCGECRKEQYRTFKAAWFATQNVADLANAIAAIDKALHSSRLTGFRTKKTFYASLGELPYGAIFEHESDVFLHWRDGPFKWTAMGYQPPREHLPIPCKVQVLTPQPLVDVIRWGYTVQVHGSALITT